MKKILSVFKLILIGTILLSFVGCAHDIPEVTDANNNTGGGNPSGGGNPPGGTTVPCDPNKIYFKQQVLPILISNCAMSGCHDDITRKEGVVLTSYERVMSTAGIRPGRPNDSELYERITDNDPDDRMPRPPMSPLSQQQIQIIYQWIQQGAQNLECSSMCDENSFTYSGTIKLLVANKCQGCHSGSIPQGGINLSTYEGVRAKVSDGRLWGAINHQAGFSPMPKNGTKLSECEIEQFRKWIDAGAPNN